MNLKVNYTNFSKTNISKASITPMQERYTGIPNFHPHYVLNPKQSFCTKVLKFFKALYYANFKK